LKIRVIRPAELSPADIAAWWALQDGDPNLSSPFFSPEFTQAVGFARTDARVAVVEQEQKLSAFFPFQRRGNSALPIGAAICDYQGLIGARSCPMSARELLDGCGLDAVDFNHVPAAQDMFSRHRTNTSHSPYLNLEKGYSEFLASRKAHGVHEIAGTLRKMRKLDREIGAVRFAPDDDSDMAWQNLIAWKNAQYRSSNQVETLGRPWVADTLAMIRSKKTTRFSGLLSTLYAGDKLLAVHFGMASQTDWHYWFPAYNMDYHRYSPGLILLLKMAEHAAGNGFKIIDLGRGSARYKSAFANGAIELCEGSIERPASISGALRITCRLVERGWASLPVGSAKHWPRRLFNRLLWRV
jgi:CelD/BcsL family acetyltransferase involved in cellulose biosynthesis